MRKLENNVTRTRNKLAILTKVNGKLLWFKKYKVLERCRYNVDSRDAKYLPNYAWEQIEKVQ